MCWAERRSTPRICSTNSKNLSATASRRTGHHDEGTIHKAVELLRQAAPEATIILFGFGARGEAKEDSDLDFLVVEPSVASRREEIVHLLEALRPLRIPVDVLVVGQKAYDEWADTPNTVLYQAAREGRVFHAVARTR